MAGGGGERLGTNLLVLSFGDCCDPRYTQFFWRITCRASSFDFNAPQGDFGKLTPISVFRPTDVDG